MKKSLASADLITKQSETDITVSKVISNQKSLTHFLRLTITILFVFFQGLVFSQTAPVSPPKGGFKIDGRLRANVTTQAGDWVPRLNSQTFTAGVDSFVIDASGAVEDNVTTKLARDKFDDNTDNIFTQGSKFNDYISALHWGTGGAPNKNDIHNGLFHASGNPGPGTGAGDQWVFIAGDRLDVSGTSYIDFQFLQGTITTNASTFTGSGPAGGRTLNDINVSMEYNNGGTAPKVVIYRWAPTNEAGTAWGWDSTGSASITQAYAQTNLAATDVPFGGFGNPPATTYQAFAFVEAAINVTQLVTALGGNCSGLSIKTLWITTKASSSSTAALKDFMSPISIDLNFGGVSMTSIGPFCAGAANVTLEASPSGGTFGGPGVTGSVFSPQDAGVGTHTISYSATVGANCTKSTTMQVIVNPNPTVTVNSPVKCTSDPAVNISATPGSGASTDYDYAWSVPAGVPAPGNVPNFTANVAGNYTVVITNKTTQCVSQPAQGTLTVNPNPAEPSVTVTPPNCGNSANGTVTVTSPLDGGGFDYEYSNNGGQYQEGVSFTVAAGAGFSIVARNKATLCVSTAETGTMGTAAGAPPAGDVVIVTPVSCSSSTGELRVVVAATGSDYSSDFEIAITGTDTWYNPTNHVFQFTAGAGYHFTVRRKSDHTCTTTVDCEGESVQRNNTNNANTESSSRVATTTINMEGQTTVKAYPNPFNDRVKFVVKSPEAGYATLEVLNMLGQKVKTVYTGQLPAGEKTFEMMMPYSSNAPLIYILRMNGKQVTGKLIQAAR